MRGIFETLKESALVQQTGGGTGFSFSKLRPKGDLVGSTGGEASGPVSFMKIFDSATEHIKQGGKRRGANMGVLRVNHPDILEFIHSKASAQGLQNFNISVGVTNAFLHAARDQGTYDLIHPRTQKPTGRLFARTVFDAMVGAAWETGDPGIVFLDAINRENPTPCLGSFETTNPCGEVPLLPHESCNLGSINLVHHLQLKNGSFSVDWAKLRSTIHTAVRFLDNLIEVNHYPTSQIDQASRGNRKIGLGIMGFAEFLISLKIPYDSDQAVQVAEQLMGTIAQESWNASEKLAEERGIFPNWGKSVYGKENQPIRNATRNAIAPTGTISLIAGTTPGIEPLFALMYRRSHSLGGKPLYEMSRLLLEYCKKNSINPEQFIAEVSEKGGLEEIETIPGDIKHLFKTALDISVEQHLHIQAAFQRHVDNAVSKTINLPEDAMPEQVAQAFWQAWELGLKGITVFRYGCRGNQVLELGFDRDFKDYVFPSHCRPCG
jgi:ribonucleoside-diphosphate reductase alpha chain